MQTTLSLLNYHQIFATVSVSGQCQYQFQTQSFPTWLQIPHLVRTAGVVLTPCLHPGPSVHVAPRNVEDEAVPLTPEVLPLHPPLLVDLTMVIPTQNSCSRLLTTPLQVHCQACLVNQRPSLPPPKCSLSTSLPNHDQLIGGAIQAQAQTIEMAEQ